MKSSTTNARLSNSYRRILAMVLLLVLPLSILLGAGTASAQDDADDKDSDLSFYRVASTMMSYFSNAQAPDGEEGDVGEGFSDSWAESGFLEDPGSAGSFLGYLDEDFSFSAGWVESSLSGSSSAIGYGTLLANDETGGQLSGASGMQEYAQFGATLNGLGFDGTSTGLSSGFFKVITGGVVSVLYTLTFVVDIIFAGMLDMLVLLNPFKLFVSGVGLFNREFANGMVGGDTAVYGPLQGLDDTVTDWYQFAAMLGWTVMVPLFLSLLLISMLLFKKMDKGSAIKRFCIRLLFLGVGLPLLGSMYTGMVNAMEDATDSGNMGSTRVVMSTYVDFENWALKNRLAVPGGGANAGSAVIGWNAEEDQPTGLSLRNARDSALAINAQALGIEGIDPVVGGSDESWTQAATGAGDEAGLDQSTYAQVNSMLRRFMSVDQVTGAAFESDAKSSLTSSSYYTENDRENQPEIEKWFSDFDDEDDLADRGEEAINNPVLAVSKGTGLRARNNEEGDTGIYFTTTGDTSVNGCKARISTDSGNPGRCNLAPLAIYNYLNTDFDSTSLTLYSSDQVMSEATRSVHNSVNQVGTGTMGFLYWVNAVVLMGSFVAIGLLYALPLLLANLRRTIQIVVAVPFAALGAIAAIAKVIIYSIVLAMEVVITIFAYKLVQEFLLSLPQLIEAPLAAVLSDPSPDTRQSTGSGGFLAFLLAGQGFTMVVTLVLIAFVIMFTVMALRIRKALVTAIEEASTRMVEKFMDTSIGSPSSGGGGAIGRAGGVVAAGAGAGVGRAVGDRMMSNRGGPSRGSSNTGGTNEGPGVIKTDGDVGGKVDTDGKLTTEGKDGDRGRGIDGDGGTRARSARTGAGRRDEQEVGVGMASARTAGRSANDEMREGQRVAAEGLSNPPGHEQRDAEAAGRDSDDGNNTDKDGADEQDGRMQRPPVAVAAMARPATAQGGSERTSVEGTDHDDGDTATDRGSRVDNETRGRPDGNGEPRRKTAAQGAQGVGRAGAATARGALGDAAGTRPSDSKAVQRRGAALGSQAEQDAGQSSLDGPDRKRAQKTEVAQAGARVGDTAGKGPVTRGGGVSTPVESSATESLPTGEGPHRTATASSSPIGDAAATSRAGAPAPRSQATRPPSGPGGRKTAASDGRPISGPSSDKAASTAPSPASGPVEPGSGLTGMRTPSTRTAPTASSPRTAAQSAAPSAPKAATPSTRTAPTASSPRTAAQSAAPSAPKAATPSPRTAPTASSPRTAAPSAPKAATPSPRTAPTASSPRTAAQSAAPSAPKAAAPSPRTAPTASSPTLGRTVATHSGSGTAEARDAVNRAQKGRTKGSRKRRSGKRPSRDS